MLPNELLHIVCSHLTGFEIHRAFSDLNARLTGIISDYTKHFNLTQMKFQQFEECCRVLLQSDRGAQIQSLCLSNRRPVVNEIALFLTKLRPLHERLPNLQCLKLFGATTAELMHYLPNTILLQKLAKLSIESKKKYTTEDIDRIFFEDLVKNLGPIQQLSLKGICLTNISQFQWLNNTVTHLNIDIERIAELISILRVFRNLQYLSVNVVAINDTSQVQCNDAVPALQLKEFRLKSFDSISLPTFDDLVFSLNLMPNLHSFKCQLNIFYTVLNEDYSTYADGDRWHMIRNQFKSLANFDCSFRYKILCNTTCQGICQSFSSFPYWTVKVYPSLPYATEIFVFTKRPHRSIVEILPTYFEQYDGQKITSLINRASAISIDWNDYEREDDIPTLTLSCPNFSHIKSLLIGYPLLYFDDQLKEFLRQLFHGSSILNEIILYLSIDESAIDNILHVLYCLSQPINSVTNLSFRSGIRLDETTITIMAYYLPSLVSFTLMGIDELDDVAEIVSACVKEMKHLTYLEFHVRHPGSVEDGSILKLRLMECEIHAWLMQNTSLGDLVTEREFYAECSEDLKIWLS
ncbi:unnamed protein product [Adineta ricciae]|uniref:Uncharacterized protein n=2 Tax=Adineta ricciae TaxID=249248 RepID=A0A815UPK5_ADIRI|nr:unnamed protein product [Adineta ricciae]